MQGSGLPQARTSIQDKDAARAQLQRILTSSDFNVPSRLRSFLSFVVEEVLAGHGDRIKAFTIATSVFGRGDDFDVVNDPVVRIEAGRLRRALERYYLLAGRDDPVVIDIPKGTYAPSISWRSSIEQPSPPPAIAEEGDVPIAQKPTSFRPPRSLYWKFGALVGSLVICLGLAIAVTQSLGRRSPAAEGTQSPEIALTVTPFANLSGSDGALYAAGISDELLNQLSRFRELRVIRRQPTAGNESVEGLGAQYLLEGGVRAAGQQLRVSARLLDGGSSKILWSQVYDRSLNGSGNIEIESDIAAKVAMAVAQPYGAIFSPVSAAANIRAPSNAEAYICVLHYYHYRKVLNKEEHALTRECLERTTSRFPDYSTGWAMLSHLYLDEDRYDLNRRPASAGLDRARDAAERAIQLDPANVRGLQALMTVLFFRREPELALRVGERALALNPNDSEMLAELGSRIAQAGDWQRGSAMMETALERNPAQTGYYIGLIALARYMEGDNKRAVELIKRADLARFSIYHFVAALIFAKGGLEAERKASVAEFLRMRPRFFDDFGAELAMRNFNPRDRVILIEGARQAGFPVGGITQ
ncbi:TPR_REGION domain-containing protein [Hyphomicrobiales bacterium]|nr:TPR_REGION domain-containing protein [Hyphomicrobiales bacterium]CAH1697295.1 TPR_REGION domain-containing protein [Hyphomicrobiales bacterium]CAI0343801.1 TPR_REGION domain-containing protein [Hyphomicrobiales bacterium]